MFALRYSKSATKVLARMPTRVAMALHGELSRVAANPSGYRGDWKPLQGSPYWRLRQGGYRAVCELRNNDLVLLVIKIGTRGDIYK